MHSYTKEGIDSDYTAVWLKDKFSYRDGECKDGVHFCPICLWKSQPLMSNIFEKLPSDDDDDVVQVTEETSGLTLQKRV